MNGLIFDWDNTLVDTIPAIKQSLSDTLNEFEHPYDNDEILSSAGINLSLREGFPKVFGDNWQQAGKFFYSRYEINQKLITKMAYFDECIEFLSNINVPLAINSNKKQQHLEYELKLFGISELFPLQMGSGACENDKPAPDGVFKILSEWKIEPSKDIYYIGDSEVDFYTAKNAGITPIIINLDADVNTTKISNLNELISMLKNI